MELGRQKKEVGSWGEVGVGLGVGAGGSSIDQRLSMGQVMGVKIV